jgi:hypothetical protein
LRPSWLGIQLFAAAGGPIKGDTDSAIEEGKIADLVPLDANPLDDINNAKKINMVVKAGQIIDRSKLDLPVNRKLASGERAPLLMTPMVDAVEF